MANPHVDLLRRPTRDETSNWTWYIKKGIYSQDYSHRWRGMPRKCPGLALKSWGDALKAISETSFSEGFGCKSIRNVPTLIAIIAKKSIWTHSARFGALLVHCLSWPEKCSLVWVDHFLTSLMYHICCHLGLVPFDSQPVSKERDVLSYRKMPVAIPQLDYIVLYQLAWSL